MKRPSCHKAGLDGCDDTVWTGPAPKFVSPIKAEQQAFVDALFDSLAEQIDPEAVAFMIRRELDRRFQTFAGRN